MMPGEARVMANNYSELISDLRDGELKVELYEIILPIAQNKKSFKEQRSSNSETAEDYALEFIIYLRNNAGVGDLRTKSDLNREFNRWITRKNAGENHELWSIISIALLSLEKDKKCMRGAGFENYYNSNETLWMLSELKNSTPDLTSDNKLINDIPVYCPKTRKSGAKNQSKIITPSVARELVMHILQAVHGPVKMEAIVQIARQKVVLRDILRAQGEKEEDDDNSPDPVADKPLALLFAVQEEVENRAGLIWKDVLQIKRGKNIAGEKILCLYIIPTMTLGKKIILDTFGPSSTVHDVKVDIEKILRRYLDLDTLADDSSEACFPVEDIKIGIIQKINSYCSEKGYETGL